jgi:hypothetical protein
MERRGSANLLRTIREFEKNVASRLPPKNEARKNQYETVRGAKGRRRAFMCIHPHNAAQKRRLQSQLPIQRESLTGEGAVVATLASAPVRNVTAALSGTYQVHKRGVRKKA